MGTTRESSSLDLKFRGTSLRPSSRGPNRRSARYPASLSGSSAPISVAESSPTASCACTATIAGSTASWPSRARAGGSSPPAAASALRTRRAPGGPSAARRAHPTVGALASLRVVLPARLRRRSHERRARRLRLHGLRFAETPRPQAVERRARPVRRRRLRAALWRRPQPEPPLSLARAMQPRSTSCATRKKLIFRSDSCAGNKNWRRSLRIYLSRSHCDCTQFLHLLLRARA